MLRETGMLGILTKLRCLVSSVAKLILLILTNQNTQCRIKKMSHCNECESIIPLCTIFSCTKRFIVFLSKLFIRACPAAEQWMCVLCKLMWSYVNELMIVMSWPFLQFSFNKWSVWGGELCCDCSSMRIYCLTDI